MYVRNISEFSLCFDTLYAFQIMYQYVICTNNLHLPKTYQDICFAASQHAKKLS